MHAPGTEKMSRRISYAVLVTLLAFSTYAQAADVQELPPDAPAPPGSAPRIINGMVSTAEIADWRATEIKNKLLTDKKVMGCFGLKPSNVHKVFDASAMSCKLKAIKEHSAKVKPPEGVEKASGEFIFCLRDTMLKKQGVAPEKFMACAK
jgi:hypothetical protein